MEEAVKEEKWLPTTSLPDWHQVLTWTVVALFSPLLVWLAWDQDQVLRLSRLALLTRGRETGFIRSPGNWRSAIRLPDAGREPNS